MISSFWAFKGESLGTTMAAATQAQGIWSRLSDELVWSVYGNGRHTCVDFVAYFLIGYSHHYS